MSFVGSGAFAQTVTVTPPPGAPPAAEGAPAPAAGSAAAIQENPQAQVVEPKEAPSEMSLEIYGFAMTDGGYEFGQTDPNWFDVMRPTKLPSFDNEFAPSGRTFMSVRQTRFGVKGSVPTPLGELKTTFEFDMFGVGPDAGQTTIRPRHYYGELGQFGFGQTHSPFMDIDVFPNTIEYWGPSGMAFFRNVQFFWRPYKTEYSRVTIALERPGASADQGAYKDRVELANVVPHFPLPDLSAEARYGGPWGYIELAGILRSMKWKDVGPGPTNISGSATGWGVNLSSNINFPGKHILKLQALYGQGIENYMNDAPADVGPVPQPGNAVTPVTGKALPVLGLVAFIDLNWNKYLTSSLGYSLVKIWNSQGQAPNAFKNGHYAAVNLLVHPVEQMLVGPEFLWGRRQNNSDGWKYDDYRIQVSAKYSFSATIGPKKK
ncbi:MAG: DcaP family trimeric outer membrane transporter [Polyangiales bacterium]